jgi:hypothetical protein
VFAVYFTDFFAAVGVKLGERALGFFHLVTGGWLMYFAIGYHWRVQAGPGPQACGAQRFAGSAAAVTPPRAGSWPVR